MVKGWLREHLKAVAKDASVMISVKLPKQYIKCLLLLLWSEYLCRDRVGAQVRDLEASDIRLFSLHPEPCDVVKATPVMTSAIS